jgi:hypothetical protein
MKPYVLSVVMLLVMSGCAATVSSIDQAFSAGQRIQGNAESIPASMELTWGEALEVLSGQGFIVRQLDMENHFILAGRELQDQQNEALSYSVTITLVFVPLSDQVTRVMVAASQTTELHEARFVWWYLLRLIPVFPIGTDYTTSVVTRDMVRSPQFYIAFFNALKDSIEERKFLQPSGQSPASAPAPIPPPPAAPAAPQHVPRS